MTDRPIFTWNIAIPFVLLTPEEVENAPTQGWVKTLEESGDYTKEELMAFISTIPYIQGIAYELDSFVGEYRAAKESQSSIVKPQGPKIILPSM